MRYVNKPVEIEAIQWDGKNLKEVLSFTGKHPNFDKWFNSFDEYQEYVESDGFVFKVFTLDGVMNASVGDYIVRGVKGEYYPCKPDIFKATYNPVDGVFIKDSK